MQLLALLKFFDTGNECLVSYIMILVSNQNQ